MLASLAGGEERELDVVGMAWLLVPRTCRCLLYRIVVLNLPLRTRKLDGQPPNWSLRLISQRLAVLPSVRTKIRGPASLQAELEQEEASLRRQGLSYNTNLLHVVLWVTRDSRSLRCLSLAERTVDICS